MLLAMFALVPVAKVVLWDTLDPDFFIHLQAANQMLRDGVGPIVDSQSFMSIREPWTPYSWLAELLMKVIWDAGGFRAAMACHASMASGLICLYALAAITRISLPREEDGKGVLFRTILATAFAAFLSIPFLSFRPVTLALVIMAACVWLLVRDRVRHERTRAVWLVIPINAFLINIHLYAIIIPAWLLALWTGALIELWRSPNSDKAESRRRLVRYTIIGFATALACFATPMLKGAIQSIVFYQTGDAMVAGPVVKEYQPFYAGTPGTISAVLVAIIVLCAIVRFRKLRAGEIVWLIGSIVLLFRMGRFSPVFAMVAAPIFAATLPQLSDRVLGLAITRLSAMAAIGVALYQIVPALPWRSMTLDGYLTRNGPNMPGYPVRAAAYVEQNITPRTGRIINEYDWGGYLSWRLGPKYQVFIDGRTNLFTGEFWKTAYLGSVDDRIKILQAAHADAAILRTGDPRYQPILEGLGWRIAPGGIDGRATVMVPPDAVLPSWLKEERDPD